MTKTKGLSYAVFILFFITLLVFLSRTLPYTNTTTNVFNRILPLGGILFGQEPEVWVGDVATNQRVTGKGKENRPISVDVDFIKVKGQWYKIKGPVYITGGKRILGWHRKMTQVEAGELGKWLFLVE